VSFGAVALIVWVVPPWPCFAACGQRMQERRSSLLPRRTAQGRPSILRSENPLVNEAFERRAPPRTLAGATILQIVPALREEPTARAGIDIARMLLQAGARAVVFKRFAVETLMEALRAVAEGHVWMPPALQTELTARMLGTVSKTLTSRERQIVRLVGLGFHNAEIAERLRISEVTVKTHLNNVFRKLDLRDRVGVTLYAIRTGLIGIHEQAE